MCNSSSVMIEIRCKNLLLHNFNQVPYIQIKILWSQEVDYVMLVLNLRTIQFEVPANASRRFFDAPLPIRMAVALHQSNEVARPKYRRLPSIAVSLPLQSTRERLPPYNLQLITNNAYKIRYIYIAAISTFAVVVVTYNPAMFYVVTTPYPPQCDGALSHPNFNPELLCNRCPSLIVIPDISYVLFKGNHCICNTVKSRSCCYADHGTKLPKCFMVLQNILTRLSRWNPIGREVRYSDIGQP